MERNEIAQILNMEQEKVSTMIIKIKHQILNRLRKGINKRETITDLFPGYTEDQILAVIDTLSDQNKKMIELKYGLNNNNQIENNEIRSQLNIDPSTMSCKFYQSKVQIAKKLQKKFK